MALSASFASLLTLTVPGWMVRPGMVRARVLVRLVMISIGGMTCIPMRLTVGVHVFLVFPQC